MASIVPITEQQTAPSEKPSPRRQVARVFFDPTQADRPLKNIRGLELENHMANVATLAEQWDYERALMSDQFPQELTQTRQWLIQAAARHDEGKPGRFRINIRKNRKTDKEEWNYSFAGHRFDVTDDNPYIQWLIRLHHEYSVDGITQAQAELRQLDPQADPRVAQYLEQRKLAHCFPLDLYTLEMCDQIETEAAVQAFEDKSEQPHRVFMEHEVILIDRRGDTVELEVYPYPFQEEQVTLTFKSFVVEIPAGKQDFAELKHHVLTAKDVRWEERTAILRPASWHDSQYEIRDPVAAYHACGLDYEPNPMQTEMFRRVQSGDCAALLKAPTGTGKTEAVAVPALTAHKRLVLVYPALSLIEDQIGRLSGMLQKLSEDEQSRRALVVDSGAMQFRRVWIDGRRRNGHVVLPEQPDEADEQDEGSHDERRHLYHADVILTSLDKLLYRFFGYGEEKKSYIFPFRLRYGRDAIFCFDEAHSYDDIAFQNFVNLVRALGFNAESPRDLVVMTATMPGEYQQELTDHLLDAVDFTSGEGLARLEQWYQDPSRTRNPIGAPKTFTFIEQGEPNDDPDENPEMTDPLIPLLVDQVGKHHRQDRRTIVVTEKVATAIALYRKLKDRYGENALLYHGRQVHKSRTKIYQDLKRRDGKDEGESYLLVTTSAIEVGCDLNAHTLITQLCNPEQLIQRAGRCNRTGTLDEAEIVVVGRKIPGFTRTVSEETEEKYLDALRQVSSQRFDPQPLLILPRRPHQDDPRAQTLFDMQYEYVYEAERANKALHDKGLVVTRSWDPTIMLVTEIPKPGKSLENPLQVSLVRCKASNERKLTPGCQLYVERYDEQKREFFYEPASYSGCAYTQDLILVVPSDQFCTDPTIGYETLPKGFVWKGGRKDYRRWVMRPRDKAEAAPDATEDDQAVGDAASKSSEDKGPLWWWFYERMTTLNEREEVAPVEDESEESDDEDEE